MRKFDFFMHGFGKDIFCILVIVFALMARFLSVRFIYLIIILAIAYLMYDIYLKKFRPGETFDRIIKAFNIKNDAKSNLPSDFPFPSVVFDGKTGEILWQNESFARFSGASRQYNITEVFRGVSPSDGEITENISEIAFNDRHYIAYKSRVKNNNVNKKSTAVIMHLIDVTHYTLIKQNFERSRPIVAIIMIDNYEELVKKCSEAEKSLILADIDRIISEWKGPIGGVLLRYDRDRYLFVCESGKFNKLNESEFPILNQIKKVSSNEKIAATLSIGIGCEGENLGECFEYARLAIDMALSRSGDQVVIKRQDGFQFFGGRDVGEQKRTRIRSRVCANVFKNLIKDSDYVIVMGHKMADLDCIGAEAGVVCLCRALGKKCFVVLDREHGGAAEALVKRLERLEEYEGVFISPSQALKMDEEQRLIVVVDTNRPESVEEQRLISGDNARIAVIDHHRRAASYIKDSVINMHELSASSASELSAELIYHMLKPEDVLKQEAEAMLAGIYLDTKAFSMKAGERTFEIAAMLRRMGADTVAVKQLFQIEKVELFDKNRIVETAQIHFGSIAISKSEEETSRATAGKAADELLDITGVKASMVIFKCNNQTLISARSLGHANVQLIMEKLGGGGTLTNAGVQLDLSIGETEAKLMKAIRDYLKIKD